MQLSRSLLLGAPALLAVSLASPLQAENTVQTNDYVAVWFEAEEYDSKGLRWVLTDANTGQTEDDPDGNHSGSASGGKYLEVLPDYRVTGEDEFHPDGSLWNAFQGPELTFNSIDFPEAGRYYVHLRSYSTGSEDNGAHIGIAGDFPPQARRMQWCGGKHQWTWSSAQRDSGGNGSCGREKTVYIDVPTAGSHEINIQAREDGFEVDRIVFIKDLSGNTKVCSPSGAAQISCVDGAIESADELIDLRVKLETDVAEVAAGGTVLITAKVENLDPFDHATDLVTEITLDPGMTFVAAPDECTHAAGVVTCEHGDLEPTAPDEYEEYPIEVTATAAGTMTVEAVVSATETEQFPFNDTASVNIEGVASIPDVDLQIEVAASSSELNIGNEAQISITLVNPSADDANGVQLVYTVPEGADVTGLPSQCAAGDPITCALGVITGGVSQTSVFDIQVQAEGVQVHAASMSLNNESNAANNSDTVIIDVADPNAVVEAEIEPETTTETDTDSSTATDQSTDNGTGIGGTTDTTVDSDADGVADVTDTGSSGISGGSDTTTTGTADTGNVPEGGTQQANSGIEETENNSSGGSGSAGMIFMLLLGLFAALVWIATARRGRVV